MLALHLLLRIRGNKQNENFERYIVMFDYIIGLIVPLLSALEKLPCRVLVGLALSGIVFLFIPTVGNEGFEFFRIQWKNWIIVWSVLFSSLSIVACIANYLKYRKSIKDKQRLKLFLHESECWWTIAKQQDGSYVSQISLKVDICNLSNSPIGFIKVRLIYPKTKSQVLHAEMILPAFGSPYHSKTNKVPPHETVKSSIDILVRDDLLSKGGKLRLTIGITDQFGEEYRLKGIINPTPKNSI